MYERGLGGCRFGFWYDTTHNAARTVVSQGTVLKAQRGDIGSIKQASMPQHRMMPILARPQAWSLLPYCVLAFLLSRSFLTYLIISRSSISCALLRAYICIIVAYGIVSEIPEGLDA
jgi:hypothetical protein